MKPLHVSMVTLVQILGLAFFTILYEACGLQCPRVDQEPKGSSPKLLRVAAFNIQRFGKNKVNQPDVIDIIVKILSRYDIVLVEEIVDKQQEALQQLVDMINSQCNTDVYQYTVSPRVGRTMSKEQYAYIFRSDAVKVVQPFLYSDPGDIFEREPFVATFIINGRQSKNQLQNLTLIGIHTKPSAAKTELQHLHEPVEYVESKRLSNVMILGDFNGDCEYVRKKHWSTIPMWTESSKYEWLIATGVDTTTKSTVCAYDRIVVTGSVLKNSVVKDSAVPFRYDEEFDLNQKMTELISDHYPVEVLLKIKN